MTEPLALFLKAVDGYREKGMLPDEHARGFVSFSNSYFDACRQGGDADSSIIERLFIFLRFFLEQLGHPYIFESYHKAIRGPFDYQAFGLEFIRPLIDFSHSRLIGERTFEEIERRLAAGDNVFFLANHQTEPDAQILTLLFQNKYSVITENLTFVAGHRVTADPWAAPFSLGCNLFCIWSKKHMDESDLEKKRMQMEQNRQTIQAMQGRLESGGVAIYVAPSGGRDRPDAQGAIQPAPFDTSSVELFCLAARHCKKKTFLYPLALATYQLLPPPAALVKELGEPRSAHWTAVKAGVAPAWEDVGNCDAAGREARAAALYNAVKELYNHL